MNKAARRLLLASILLCILVLLAIGTLWAAQRSFIFPAPNAVQSVPSGFRQIELHTQDGLTLRGVYRQPASDAPTIVFFHGNGDSWTGAAVATELFAQSGYGILLPEYRGYAGNPGSPSQTGLFHDGRAAMAFLATQNVGPEHTIVIGNSIGSGVATQIALEFQPAALILISPFSALNILVGEKLPYLPARLLVRDPFDNLSILPDVRAPILLLHGTLDNLIPPVHSERLAAAQNHAALQLVPGAGHDLAYTRAAQTSAMRWLAQIRPGPAQDQR